MESHDDACGDRIKQWPTFLQNRTPADDNLLALTEIAALPLALPFPYSRRAMIH